MKRIFFFSEYLTQKYGKALYRIPLNLPFSCPHRERNSGAGCIFCAEDGAKARHLKHHLDIPAQVKSGIEYASRRYSATAPYIAYLQSFTNTYGDLETLKKYYSEVLACADFKILIIATRPDCLPDTTVQYLKELAKDYELWVELGVQSAQDKTLKLINRQHDFKCVEDAVKRLAAAGIKSAAHMIIGLPGETMDDYRDSARKISELPFSAVKIHNLLVLRNTELAKLYSQGSFQTMNEYEYAAALVEFLKIIPDNWPIMRLNADADPKDIIAPKWWMKKSQFLDYLISLMERGGSIGNAELGMIPGIKTEDGSFTLYHPEYRQHFHTLAGAGTESIKKFIEPSKLAERLLSGNTVKILDIGFGLGYNAIAAIRTAEKTNGASLEIISLEKDVKTLQTAMQFFQQDSLEYQIISSLLKNSSWQGCNSKITILIHDARSSVKTLNETFDCIFLDAFSPDSNPELWTFDFIKKLVKLMKNDAVLTTYSSAFPVIGALMRSGLHIGETEAFGRKKGGIIASKTEDIIIKPLALKEINIVQKSTAGLPYRDLTLNQTRENIIAFREKLTARLRRRGIPKWYKD